MSGAEIAVALGYISSAQSIDQMLEDTFSLGKLSYKAYDQGGVTNSQINIMLKYWKL
jgi:predicted RecA/RadA family phage recombinase